MKLKKFIACAAASLVMAAVMPQAEYAHASIPHRAKPLTVNILHMNDHHSHLAADDLDIDVSGLELTTTLSDGSPITEVNVSFGGFARLVNTFKRYENLVKNPIKIHAGDAITGTPYYSLFKGEADAAVMNQICFDAFALGNHEFDDGDSGLANFLDFLDSGQCDTPVLAANVIPASTSAIRDGYIQPGTILNIQGEKVGLVGIDIAQKTKESSNPDEGTRFLDETRTAQRAIDFLTARGVNKIILVTHYQYQNDIALAQNLRGVDVIVGGDSHTLLGDETFTELGLNVQGDYPTKTTDLDGNQVCIVHAWEYAHLMGHLNVRFDKNGEVKACAGHPIMPMENRFAYQDSDGEEKEITGEDQTLIRRDLGKNPEIIFIKNNSETEQLMADFDAQVAELEQTIIGSAVQDLCLERWPGQGRSTLCDRMATYEHGSDISNIVAKAFLTVTPTADFAIQNGGGVRVDVGAGDYSIADAYTLLPFSNTLVTLEMTGQQIIDVLEDALSNTLDAGGSSGSYPYASGLRYEVDASQTVGSRISSVEVNSQMSAGWSPIDLTATYTVVTNNYIASGKDGYTTFGEIFAEGLYVDTYTEYAQGFIDYVELITEEGEELDLLPVEEYSTKRYIGRDGCDHSAQTDCIDY